MTLPDEVADAAYTAGWGEAHPLTGTPLIFGPRDEAELLDDLDSAASQHLPSASARDARFPHPSDRKPRGGSDCCLGRAPQARGDPSPDARFARAKRKPAVGSA
jgi:hypothetical protein